MLDSTEDEVKESDDTEATEGTAVTSNNTATLVSAESLSAAYRALGNAALSVLHGDAGDDLLV